MKITEYNFIGDYKSKTPDGSLIQYNKGDVVYLNNETFLASKRILGYSPLMGEDSGWLPISKMQLLYELDHPPFYPKVGDEWLDTKTGIKYKRINNKETEYWVEL